MSGSVCYIKQLNAPIALKKNSPVLRPILEQPKINSQTTIYLLHQLFRTLKTKLNKDQGGRATDAERSDFRSHFSVARNRDKICSYSHDYDNVERSLKG